MKIYAVYDKKMSTFSPPFYVQHEAQAIRSLTTTVNAGDNQIAEYASDFDLYYLGSFDESQGHFEESKEFVCNAATLKRLPENGGALVV